MLRTTTIRPLLKSLASASTGRSSYSLTAASRKIRPGSRPLGNCRPRAVIEFPIRPTATSVLLYATAAKPPLNDGKRKILDQRLEPHPDEVSAVSSVRQVFEGKAGGRAALDNADDTDMLAGVKSDMATIKETFALTDVPKESYYIGAAGVLPYLATSLSTVFLAWDINHGHFTGSGHILSPETAHQLLDILTPLQIGYGAVIISFLGAIHWGLEYAGYGGHQSYRRYAIGVIAPAVAWPTLLMPVEIALTTQFLAFNFLYFADAKATAYGWAPPWYATYRFVLTFVVGASIVISLIGRGQIVSDGRLHGAAAKMQKLQDAQWEALEKEERERRAHIVAADEEGGEDGKEEEDKDE